MTSSTPQQQPQATESAPAVEGGAEEQQQKTTEEPMAAPATEPRGEETGGATVLKLHTAHPRVPIPYVTPGDMVFNARTMASAVPSPRRLAFYGLLGAFAVAGALEWPVAIAVGAATEVISRERGERRRLKEQRLEQAPQAATTVQPAQATRPA
ncbi:hypothetical protein ACFY2M_34810 [Streptomyces sp. NPDC001276]|uniref:hypothetical protein n=1 Tax=Streptomyces sp. NPDC001276 TaxID=3364555 RepID=UPI0036CAFC42